MIPPTSIDGTDITGATIDGTDVTEITVDGQTVFTAQNLPVAYSNLIAWYPFDSAEYGGSNADDVTALFNPGQSGDSTAFDGTVNGATFQSSGGVTDINAGANSGAFEFDGSNDRITLPSIPFGGGSLDFTMMAWEFFEGSSPGGIFGLNGQRNIFISCQDASTIRFFVRSSDGSNFFTDETVSSGQYNHVALVYTSTSFDAFINGSLVSTVSGYNGAQTDAGTNAIGNFDFGGGFTNPFDGKIDDVRLYDRALSSSEISDIYNNTDV